jgi:hypothetical protein
MPLAGVDEVSRRALASERLRSSRLIARIRFIGISIAFAFNWGMAHVFGDAALYRRVLCSPPTGPRRASRVGPALRPGREPGRPRHPLPRYAGLAPHDDAHVAQHRGQHARGHVLRAVTIVELCSIAAACLAGIVGTVSRSGCSGGARIAVAHRDRRPVA